MSSGHPTNNRDDIFVLGNLTWGHLFIQERWSPQITFCEHPSLGLIHVSSLVETEVSLFLFLGAGFSSYENKEKSLQMESLTLSADLEKLPWNVVLVRQLGAD